MSRLLLRLVLLIARVRARLPWRRRALRRAIARQVGAADAPHPVVMQGSTYRSFRYGFRLSRALRVTTSKSDRPMAHALWSGHLDKIAAAPGSQAKHRARRGA